MNKSAGLKELAKRVPQAVKAGFTGTKTVASKSNVALGHLAARHPTIFEALHDPETMGSVLRAMSRMIGG